MSAMHMRLGALIRKYRKAAGLTQDELAVLMSERTGLEVPQPQISAHELGNRWESRGGSLGGMELLSTYIEVLSIPEREWHEAMGMPMPEEPESESRPKGFAEMVQADQTLSKAAKEHLLNQYELLQMATMHQRRGEPVLHQDKAPRRRKRA
jgi:transcriptional regulator with XRE-family HTH domain